MSEFFKAEDFNALFRIAPSMRQEKAAEIANNKINQSNSIELWILTDNHGRIYYSGSEKMVKAYKESNLFEDKIVVKLTGNLPGEK